MSNVIDRDRLIAMLSNMHQRRGTGTFYVRTEDRRLIVIGLIDGEVVSLTCGPHRGERAIPSLHAITHATYKLEDAIPQRRLADALLPPTSELLARLADEAPPPPAPRSLSLDADRIHQVLCKVLTDYLGPIAPLVCRDKVKEAGGLTGRESLARVIDSLAREIGTVTDAEGFKARVSNELRGLVA